MTDLRLNRRQQQIADLLAGDGEVKLAALKERFDVVEMTLRRDLEKLERLGLARRTFGGAIAYGRDIELHERNAVMLAEKSRIGRIAAAIVQPGESIFVDGGSTTLQLVRHLKPDAGITVVTNALNIAAELQQRGITAIVIGGMLVERTSTMVGPAAVAMLSGMALDRAFLGATGCSSRHGFCNSNMHEAEVKRTAIRQAAETNVLIDHTKFGARDLFSFAALGGVSRIVCDRAPDGELAEAIRETPLQVAAD